MHLRERERCSKEIDNNKFKRKRVRIQEFKYNTYKTHKIQRENNKEMILN